MIYLDHNATTPLRPAVRAAMAACLEAEVGNASSAHRWGRQARAALEVARGQVAAAIGAQPGEVVFTAGGTEANNLALAGIVGAGHVVVAPIEHSSVVRPVAALAARGARITWLPVDAEGRVAPDDVAAALTPDTELVSVGWANNELGTVQPIGDIARVCAARGVRLHVDAVQAWGKVPIDMNGIDLCALSAHKIGGPVGVGALFVRRGTRLRALLLGGNQERGLRPGTENVPALVGFGVAATLAEVHAPEVVALRERLWDGLADLEGMRRNSAHTDCLPNTLHLSIAGVAGEAVVAALDLDGIAVSAGSACAAGAAEPSHVLRALGRSRAEASEGVRFSLGADTTAAEVDATIAAVRRVVERARTRVQAVAAHG